MPSHGKRSTYVNFGCRCEACTVANTEYQVARRRQRVQSGTFPEGAKHGQSGYVNFGCRCEVCKKAGSLMNKRLSDARREKMKGVGLPPGDHRHGTAYGYKTWYCRCSECKAAWAAFLEEKRAKKQKS